MRARTLLLLVLLAACDRESPILLCHNGNCTSPDASRDDSVEALTESLALTYDGRFVLDGVEWDTYWHGTKNECLFAHDLFNDVSTPVSVPAQMLADHLANNAAPTWNGNHFYTFIELKPSTDGSLNGTHTPEQTAAHVQCVYDAVDTIYAGAQAGGHELTVGFVSTSPDLLAAMRASPNWDRYTTTTNVEMMLIADIFAPFSSVEHHLADFKELQAVEYHPDFMTVEKREAYRTQGLDLAEWSYTTTPESLDAIERWEPRFELSNNATLLRRWMER